jgi:hypothetical protein
MRAMLWMGKIDIDGLRRAYEAVLRSMVLWMPALSFCSSRTEHTTVDAAASLIEKETPPERAVAVTAWDDSVSAAGPMRGHSARARE